MGDSGLQQLAQLHRNGQAQPVACSACHAACQLLPLCLREDCANGGGGVCTAGGRRTGSQYWLRARQDNIFDVTPLGGARVLLQPEAAPAAVLDAHRTGTRQSPGPRPRSQGRTAPRTRATRTAVPSPARQHHLPASPQARQQATPPPRTPAAAAQRQARRPAARGSPASSRPRPTPRLAGEAWGVAVEGARDKPAPHEVHAGGLKGHPAWQPPDPPSTRPRATPTATHSAAEGAPPAAHPSRVQTAPWPAWYWDHPPRRAARSRSPRSASAVTGARWRGVSAQGCCGVDVVCAVGVRECRRVPQHPAPRPAQWRASTHGVQVRRSFHHITVARSSSPPPFTSFARRQTACEPYPSGALPVPQRDRGRREADQAAQRLERAAPKL